MTCSPEHLGQVGKALLSSKTFWLNLVGLFGILITTAGLVGDAEWIQYEAGILGVANIIMRIISGEPITSFFDQKAVNQ